MVEKQKFRAKKYVGCLSPFIRTDRLQKSRDVRTRGVLIVCMKRCCLRV